MHRHVRILSHRVALAPGDIADYHALAHHHYCAPRPATITRILAARLAHEPANRHRHPARRHTSSPATTSGASHQSCPPLAVLVESMPTLRLAGRQLALGDRYTALTAAGLGSQLLNAEMRCISRVIVYPSWRGSGLAKRLVRFALDTASTPYTEAVTRMGPINPFFARAGMTAYPIPPREEDERVRDVLAHAGITQHDLLHITPAATRLRGLPADDQHWLAAELLRWQKRAFRRQRTIDPTGQGDDALHTLLRKLRDRLIVTPVYYLHHRSA